MTETPRSNPTPAPGPPAPAVNSAAAQHEHQTAASVWLDQQQKALRPPPAPRLPDPGSADMSSPPASPSPPAEYGPPAQPATASAAHGAAHRAHETAARPSEAHAAPSEPAAGTHQSPSSAAATGQPVADTAHTTNNGAAHRQAAASSAETRVLWPAAAQSGPAAHSSAPRQVSQPAAADAAVPIANSYVAAGGAFTQGLAAGLQQEAFTKPVKPAPQSGWRKAVLKSSLGLVNPGQSRVEREDAHRIECVQANIARGAFTFAVMSGRGGVSKTTTAAALGSMFAEHRGAEVVAVDANPNEGNLASRINPDAHHTFVDILRERERLTGNVNDVRSYVARNTAHLDVLAASAAHVNPATYDATTLRDTIDVLRTNYRVIVIDCGQNINDETTSTILDLVTALVVVTGVQFDSHLAALRMHDWLMANGRSQLVHRSILVMSDRSLKPAPKIRKAFEQTVNSTVWENPIYVPYDPHLHEAGVLRLGSLARPTYRAYLEAAARLAGHYGQPPIPRAAG